MTGATTPPRSAVALDVDRYREWKASGVLWDFKPGDAVEIPGTGQTGHLGATYGGARPVLGVWFVPDDGTEDLGYIPATIVRCTRCGTLGGHLWQWLQHPNPPARRHRWHLLARFVKGSTR